MIKHMRKLFFIALFLVGFLGVVMDVTGEVAKGAGEVSITETPGTETSGTEVSGAEVSAATAPRGPVYYVKVDGVVNPVMSEYLIKSFDAAAAEGAEVVIVQLDTPGGLDLSMRDIIKAMLAADVPVIIYVAPSGSRAASAGVFLIYASHVAAMAPGTNTGSAHPVAMGGGEMDETMMKKVENDAVAYIMGIAKKKGRNVEWAEAAVRESVNITAEEALKKGVIEIVADSRADLIAALDGMVVDLASGERTLHTKGAEVKEVEMNLRFRILKALANPNVAYVLMMIGMVGLYFELSNPGVILPGVLGSICLILAFYAMQTLSVNYAGLALIILAIIFFVAEVLVVSFGLFTIAGVIAFVLGSIMLFDSPIEAMRLSLWVVIPTAVVMAVFMVGALYFIIRLGKRRMVSGNEGLIGQVVVVEDDFDAAGKGGRVFIEGEHWNAVSAGPIKRGEKVRVLSVAGLVVTVEKAASSDAHPGN